MPETTKLFVGQVPSVCTEEILRPVFVPYGNIMEISIMRDRYGKSKGCAWVTYSTKAEADSAIDNLHDKHCIPPQTNPLQVRMASTPPMRSQPSQPKQQQHQQHQQHQHQQHASNTPAYIVADPNTGAAMFAANALQFSSPMLHPFAGFGQQQMPIGLHVPAEWVRADQSQEVRHKSAMCKGGRKLFVGQLPREMREAGLREMMEAYGPVEETVMLRDRAAFVVFADKDSALRALDALRNSSTMNVRPADGEGEEDECKLFVGMIPYEATEEVLAMLFQQFGELSEVVILRQNGRSRGAAFVRYTTKEAAQSAVQNLHRRHVIPGSAHPIVVQVASAAKKGGRQDDPRMLMRSGRGGRGSFGRGGSQTARGMNVAKPASGPRGANLFVRNLPTSLSDSELDRVFRVYGDVISATVFRDRVSGYSRGFGFVSFSNTDDATRAVEALHGTSVQGHTLQVQIKSSDLEGEEGDLEDN